MSGVRPYIVRQGDYVAKIAAQLGCSEDEIWQLAENNPLREAGRSPEVLHPGDVLYVPAETHRPVQIALEGDNPFCGAVPSVPLRMIFQIGDQPRARQKCRIVGLAEGDERETGADGSITLHVPVVVHRVQVIFDDPPTTYLVDVGHTDPVSEASGLIGRLRQLGYLDSNIDAAEPSREELRAALADFQYDHGLPPEGIVDESAVARLRKEAGC